MRIEILAKSLCRLLAMGIAAAIVLAVSSQSVWAADYTWIDPPVSGNWSDGTKWDGGMAPVSDSANDIYFGGAVTFSSTVNIGATDFSLNSLNFSNTAGTVTLATGTTPALSFEYDSLSSTAATINKSGAGAAVIDIKMKVDFNGLTVNMAADSGTLQLGPNNTLNDNILGSGLLTINNLFSSQLLLANVGAFTGDIIINSGYVKAVNASGDLFSPNSTIVLGAGATFDFNNNGEDMGAIEGAGAIILGTAGMTLNKAGSRTFSGTVAGSGQMTIGHADYDTFTWGGTGTSTKTGTLTLTRGTLMLADSNDRLPTACLLTLGGAEAATLKLNGFDQRVNGLASTNAFSRVINDSATTATLTLDLVSGSQTFAGILGGSTADENNFNVRFRGAGTHVLSGSNSFSGVLTVVNSTLSIATFNNEGADGPLGNSTNAVVLGGAASTGRLLYTGGNATSNKKLSLAAGGVGVVDVAGAGVELNLSGVIDGSGLLDKRGLGTLALSGNSTLTGGIRVTAGTLALDYTVDTSERVPAGTVFTMSGGTLEIRGNAVDEITKNVDLVLPLGSASTVRAISSGGQPITLNLSSIAANGGVVNFELPTAGSISTTEPIGPWALVNQMALATKVGNAIAEAVYTADDFSGPTINTDVVAATSASDFSVNAMRFNVAAAATLTLTGTNTLESGSLLVTSNVGANAITISDGTLRGSAGGLLGIGHSSTGALTISSVIANNTLPTGLMKFGSGTTTLSGDNTFSGPTTIAGGTLVVQHANALPSASAITVASGATLRLNVANPAMGAVSLEGNSTFDLNARSGSVTSLSGTGLITSTSGSLTTTYNLTVNSAVDSVFSGSINNGAGRVGLIKNGAGTLTLAGTSNYTGGTQILGGVVEFSALANLGATATGSGNITFNNGGTLRYTGTANLNLAQSHPFVFTGNGVIDVVNPTTRLTTNTNSWSGTGTLIKTGPGELSLGSGGSGHTGKVTIAQGTLRLTSRRIPNITGMTVLAGGRYLVEDDATNQSFGFASGTLSIAGSGTDNNGAIAYVAQNNVLGSMYINNNIVLTDDAAIFVMAGSGPDRRMTLNGTITGSYTLSKIGAGYLAITGDASALAGINIVAGTLEGRADYLPENIINSGTLIFNQPFDITRPQLFSGTGSLVKQGVAQLILTGDNVYTGSTSVKAGALVLRGDGKLSGSASINVGLGARLVLDNSQGAVAGGRLVSGASLSLGGTLQLIGADNAASSETIGNVSVIGLGVIEPLNGAGTGTATLTLGSISRDARGAFVTFTGTGTTTIGTPPGSMAGWAVVGDQWAKTGAGGEVLPFAAGDYVEQADPTLWTAADNVKITGPLTGNVPTATIASLTFAAEETVTLDSFATLTLSTGGILANANGTIGGDALLLGGQAANREILAVVNGTNKLTIGARIGDAGVQAFTKIGTGTVELTGVNEHTGGTNIFGGILEVTNDSNLGISGKSINFNGGTLRVLNTFSASMATTRPVFLGTGGGAIDTNGYSFDAGVITGDGALTKKGEGSLNLGYASTFTGGVVIEEGEVVFGASNHLGASPGPVVFRGGTLRLETTAASVSINADHRFIFDGDGTVMVPAGKTLSSHTAGWSGSGTLTKTGQGMLSLGSSGSGHTGQIVVAEGTLRTFSRRLPNLTGMTILSGGQWEINDDITDNFSFASGSLVLNGDGPGGSGALAFTPQSNAQGIHTLNNPVVLASDSRVSVTNSASYVYEMILTGPITGPGKLDKSGNGILTLRGPLSYGGGTDIQGGILNFEPISDLTLGDVVGGFDSSAYLVKSGPATITATADNTFVGKLSVVRGALVLKDSGAFASATQVSVGYEPAAVSTPLASRVFAGAQLVLDNTGTSGVANRVNDWAAVNLAGSIELKGRDSESSTETIGTVNVFGGAASQLRSSPGAGGTAELTVNDVQRGGRGAVVFFTGDGTFKANFPTLTGGIIVAGVKGNDWAATSPSNEIVAYTDYETSGNPADWDSKNVKVVGPVTATDSRTINSLNLAAAETVTINDAQRLTITTGGVLASANASITGGAIGGDQPTDKELLVVVNGGSTTLTVGSVIDNVGTQGLTKAGDGTLKLTAANTYASTTNIYGGFVEIDNYAQLGAATSAIVLNGGGLRAAGDINPTTPRTAFAGVHGATFDTNGFEFRVGAISGPGSVTKMGAGTMHLNGSNSFKGDFNLLAGTVSVVGTSGSFFENETYLNVSAGATFLVNDNGEDLGGISGAGNIDTGVNPATNLDFYGTRTTEFSGVISGAGNVRKRAAGTLTLSGANTYSGSTAIMAGTLRVMNTSGSATGTGPVSVSAGATLEGTGSIDGALSVSGTLNPGDGSTTGTLTVNNSLTLTTTATAVFGIASDTQYDSLAGLTDVAFGGSLTVQSIGAPTWAIGQVFNLFSFSGSSTGIFSTITLPELPEGLSWKMFGSQPFNYSSGTIQIVSPDPATRTWIGGGVDSNIGTAANWGGSPLGADESMLFGSEGIGSPNPVNEVARSVGAITFAQSGYDVGGSATLTVSGPISAETGVNAAISAPLTLAAPSGPVSAAAGATLTLAGEVSGSQGLTKSGSGTVALTAASNTYTSDTAVVEGLLNIASGINSGGTWADSTTVALDNGSSPALVELVTAHVRQDALTINDNGKVTISATSGPASTSVVNLLQIGDGSGGFTWSFGGQGGGAVVPLSGEMGGEASPVPEPSTWALAVIALLAIGYAARRRK